MPKEIIRTSPETPGALLPGCPVFVGWTNDGDMRIATLDPHTAHDGPGTGFYATLDRRHVNQLIRVLRRARDAAYGRDE